MKLTDHVDVRNFGKPYIIAELGSNHNGDMEIAKKLIIEAKKSGADCVKFQSWSKESIFSRRKYQDNYFLADDYRSRNDYTLEEIVDEYSISENELLAMKAFADEVGIDCTSTPFNQSEADFLVSEMNAPFIKVASMDLNNYPFLSYLAAKQKTIVLSSGLSDLGEIDRAIKTIEDAGNRNIVILHCVSTYPPADQDVHLNNITTLMRAYPEYPVGFSDHSIGTVIPLAAVALGACMIEKHFTLDKDMPGWDHKVSATSDELNEIVTQSERVCQALGSSRITVTESAEKIREFRRSVVLTRAMRKGERIRMEDMDCKRPGGGFKPEMMDFLEGRAVNKDLEFDHILTPSDID
ncbi:N-acetylneuraminate synthase family protein [Litorivivens sp.]|uniref:N-acetylneuraminate synthase family protein n=1 Tax=Litorivivens sp. TaxID=2020868 RepID=UPI00356A0CF4